jgi:acetylornithine/succinyldiaminopimelate/putrescine aminotransferase
MTVEQFIAGLAERGVLCVGFGPTRVRFVPNLDTSDDDCREAARIVTEFMGS